MKKGSNYRKKTYYNFVYFILVMSCRVLSCLVLSSLVFSCRLLPSRVLSCTEIVYRISTQQLQKDPRKRNTLKITSINRKCRAKLHNDHQLALPIMTHESSKHYGRWKTLLKHLFQINVSIKFNIYLKYMYSYLSSTELKSTSEHFST